MKVLLIDDDQALLTSFELAMKQAGYETFTAGNGKDAAEKIKSVHPDIIFLDQILPDSTGNDLLKQLKENEETKNIPVAIVSNFNDFDLMKEAINLGAVDYIYKYNIEPKDLAAKVEELTKESSKVNALE